MHTFKYIAFTLMSVVGVILITSVSDAATAAESFPWYGEEIEEPLPPPPPPPAENRCVGDGLQVCRCYCRADFTQCQNNQTSYSSMPLCKVPWNNGTCAALAYFQTQATDAASCTANDGQACGGYIRPGDAGSELIGQPVAGRLLGCSIVAIQSPPSTR